MISSVKALQTAMRVILHICTHNLHPQLAPTMVGAKQVESKINYQKTGIFTPTVGVNGGCKRWVQTVGAINYAIIAGL